MIPLEAAGLSRWRANRPDGARQQDASVRAVAILRADGGKREDKPTQAWPRRSSSGVCPHLDGIHDSISEDGHLACDGLHALLELCNIGTRGQHAV